MAQDRGLRDTRLSGIKKSRPREKAAFRDYVCFDMYYVSSHRTRMELAHIWTDLSLSNPGCLLLLILNRTDVCSPLLRLFPLHFRFKIGFSRKKENLVLCSHCHTAAIAEPTCLIAHLLAPYDRAQSLTTLYPLRLNHRVHPGGPAGSENTACRLSATRAAVNPSLYMHNANDRCSAQPECFGVPVCVPPQLTPCTTTESETPSTCDCL